MKASDFDKHLDEGEADMTTLLDLDKATRPGLEVKRVIVLGCALT